MSFELVFNVRDRIIHLALFLYFCRADSISDDEKKSLVIIEYEEIVFYTVRFVECDIVRTRGLDGALGAQHAFAKQRHPCFGS